MRCHWSQVRSASSASTVCDCNCSAGERKQGSGQPSKQRWSVFIKLHCARFFTYADYALAAVNVSFLDSPENSMKATHPATIAVLPTFVSKSPLLALKTAEIARLFAHYVAVLAPWYDLNDPHRTFAFAVPEAALLEPILFKAIIAFSAGHFHKTTGTHGDTALAFHAACISELLSSMSTPDMRSQGAELAATCLLRSYELINGTLLVSLKRH